MSDPKEPKPKITMEQLQQLMALQQGMATKPKLTKSQQVIQKTLTTIMQKMQKLTVSLDRFINFITKKEGNNRNDVSQAARSPIVFGVYVILIFVGIGGIWSSVAPLDSAAVATGTLISNTNKKTIQHQEGGIIKNIFVHQGDVVTAGAKLIELDETRVKSQYENVLHQYRTALATESRLIAERDNQETIVFPEFLTKDIAVPEVEKAVYTQENLFRAQKEMYRAEKESLHQKIAQLNKQIEGYEAKKVSLAKNLEVITDRLKATRTLHAKNFVQKATLLELEAKEAGAKSEIAMTDTEIAKTYQEITKSDIEIINLQNKFTNKTLAELKDSQIQAGSLREQFYALRDSLDRIVIKSPVDGVINVLYFHTIGGVISPSNPIMEISPTNDSLLIEAKVPHKNIDSVYPGLIAKIRFSAFKSRTTPLFTGKVMSISPDIVQDKNPGAESFYIARIEIDMDEFEKVAKSRNLELHPGMQAEVQIVTGTRTLLRYLFDPLTDVMFRAFREK
ncbi:HlyD family type I secretion periplasmic adaptor subunit [Candidatus Trichorickettsia mobilis]|uniref:HlyD family type I secretion periplasmic adaptor subunit n=1 Tax=Candidatus Trichorickettsia mobilis TaxID=1346319 RepID=UPI002931E3A1|nr:HlyD family type I secretion periplasmic adaptor subunit [Candidatus Trichorickettsia mobilis]